MSRSSLRNRVQGSGTLGVYLWIGASAAAGFVVLSAAGDDIAQMVDGRAAETGKRAQLDIATQAEAAVTPVVTTDGGDGASPSAGDEFDLSEVISEHIREGNPCSRESCTITRGVQPYDQSEEGAIPFASVEVKDGNVRVRTNGAYISFNDESGYQYYETREEGGAVLRTIFQGYGPISLQYEAMATGEEVGVYQEHDFNLDGISTRRWPGGATVPSSLMKSHHETIRFFHAILEEYGLPTPPVPPANWKVTFDRIATATTNPPLEVPDVEPASDDVEVASQRAEAPSEGKFGFGATEAVLDANMHGFFKVVAAPFAFVGDLAAEGGIYIANASDRPVENEHQDYLRASALEGHGPVSSIVRGFGGRPGRVAFAADTSLFPKTTQAIARRDKVRFWAGPFFVVDIGWHFIRDVAHSLGPFGQPYLPPPTEEQEEQDD